VKNPAATGRIRDGLAARETVDQMLTPPEMRGRVSAFSFIFISCSNDWAKLNQA